MVNSKKQLKINSAAVAFIGTALSLSPISDPVQAADNDAPVSTASSQCTDPSIASNHNGLQYIVIDNTNGQTLLEQDADECRQPASTVKGMTLYLLFKSMRDYKDTDCAIDVNTEVYMTPLISQLRGDTWNLGKTGRGFESVTLNADGEPNRGIYTLGEISTSVGLYSDGRGADAIAVNAYRCEVTQQLSDLGFQIEDYTTEYDDIFRGDFINRMNETAEAMGLHSTIFGNPSGMPTEYNRSTPREIATIYSTMSQEFPMAYDAFFGRKSGESDGLHRNFNHTSGWVRGDDDHRAGKTGTTNQCGKCFAGTYEDNDYSFTIVVFGASTSGQLNRLLEDYVRDAMRQADQLRNIPVPVPRPEHLFADPIVTASTPK